MCWQVASPDVRCEDEYPADHHRGGEPPWSQAAVAGSTFTASDRPRRGITGGTSRLRGRRNQHGIGQLADLKIRNFGSGPAPSTRTRKLRVSDCATPTATAASRTGSGLRAPPARSLPAARAPCYYRPTGLEPTAVYPVLYLEPNIGVRPDGLPRSARVDPRSDRIRPHPREGTRVPGGGWWLYCARRGRRCSSS